MIQRVFLKQKPGVHSTATVKEKKSFILCRQYSLAKCSVFKTGTSTYYKRPRLREWGLQKSFDKSLFV